jgi:cytochrome c oxidase subunit III
LGDIDASLPSHASLPAHASHPEHEHPPELKHHFDDTAQQLESSTLGMWVFLLTEIMFFGGMFGGYTVYRNLYPDAFASTSHFMNVTLGGLTTGVLICSSFTMVLAVRSAQLGRKKALIWFLIFTLILGCVFLVVKYFEYHEKWVDHHIPGPGFRYAESQYFHQAQIMFFLYFAMTGMHAMHMIVGAGLLTTLIIMAARNKFSAEWFTPVEMIGLYWHFVDIVWIFLFPLLYLIGHTS